MKLTEYLTGLTIGTNNVPVLSADIRPWSTDADDKRRIVAVELYVENGSEIEAVAESAAE